MKRTIVILSILAISQMLFGSIPETDHVQAADKGVATKQLQSVIQTGIKEIPFAYASMQSDVLIRLADEPRLQSPLKTKVTPTQSYTLFFRQPMNRATVEAAIRKLAALPPDDYYQRTVPEFLFRWASDRQLHLTVTVPTAYDPRYVSRIYRIDVTGAVAKNGKKLVDSPSLTAVVEPPDQLWRISLDGKRKERLTTFLQPYHIQLLDETARYMLLSRPTKVCECDANYEQLKTLYDRQTKQLVHYPSSATTNYMGEGLFAADLRGFFYPVENRRAKLPPTARLIDKREYIHGASFSKDRKFILMAAGTREQEKDLDLIIRNLATGKEQRFPKAMRGGVWYNQVSSGRVPIPFYDDGRSVFFAMDPDTGNEKQYLYRWTDNRVLPWKSPTNNLWGGYASSSDGMYRLYPNGGLYKGKQIINGAIREGIWLPGTHLIANTHESAPTGTNETKAGGTWQLTLYDADSNKAKLVSASLPSHTRVAGGSPDGKWIYLITAEKL